MTTYRSQSRRQGCIQTRGSKPTAMGTAPDQGDRWVLVRRSQPPGRVVPCCLASAVHLRCGCRYECLWGRGVDARETVSTGGNAGAHRSRVRRRVPVAPASLSVGHRHIPRSRHPSACGRFHSLDGACPRISLDTVDQQTECPQSEFQKTNTGGGYPAIVSATEWLSGSWPDRHSFKRLCVAENSDHSACAPFSPRKRNRSHPRVTCCPKTASTV
jgi:hypothetical protein